MLLTGIHHVWTGDLLGKAEPKLWIHGHSHDRCDYVLGKTRVVANPLGYPNEVRSLEAFDPTFQVRV